jgi:hypothetical protein
VSGGGLEGWMGGWVDELINNLPLQATSYLP